MIKPVSKQEEADLSKRTRGRLKRELEEFIASGQECGEIVGVSNVSATYVNYHRCIRYNGYPLRVVRRKDRVFLIRTDGHPDA